MTDDQALLQTIIENPDDDTPRLVYADWLEERGDPRGEFLRLEWALNGMSGWDKRFKKLAAQQQEVRAKIDTGSLENLEEVLGQVYRKQWERCTVDPRCLTRESSWQYAQRCACNIMRRARHNVRLIVERLRVSGYRFAEPDRVHVPPKKRDLTRIVECEQRANCYLPLSLRVWLEEVGEVSLMGTHPDWPGTGYFFTDTPRDARHLYTDPLVVNDVFNQLQHMLSGRMQHYGSIEIAPDHWHKAGVSGGGGYPISTEQPTVEANVRTSCAGEIPFVEHIRAAFQSGGFPGYADMRHHPRQLTRLIKELKKGLLPF